MKEGRLIADVLQGDRKAIAEFVRAYSDAVYAFLYRRLDERTAVEDLCQEVFLIAWSELAKFEGRSSLKTWMCAIAQHKVADFYRRQIRELPLRDDENEGERTLDLTGQPPINLDQAFDRKLSEEKIRSTLLRMPEGHRAILRWRYWDGQSLQDIAHETGRTVKAIERLLARSRADFAARWKEDEHAGDI